MTIRSCARLVLAFGALGFAALGQAGPAEATVVNTYNAAVCQPVFTNGFDNLIRVHGVTANEPTLVVCPLVKNIFNSTGRVTAGVVATGGTSCNLLSFDVFTDLFRSSGPPEVFPGTGVSAKEFTLPSSFRGATHLRCFLEKGHSIRSIGVTEF